LKKHAIKISQHISMFSNSGRPTAGQEIKTYTSLVQQGYHPDAAAAEVMSSVKPQRYR
jgi:hypothetical protein